MSFDTWSATSADGRRVRYGYKELSDGTAAISATVDGNTLMILQKNIRAPMTREQVEAVFERSFEGGERVVEWRPGTRLSV
ncbi:MAG: hypothetical protein WB987_10090 [Candidatus Acidiferrales bacterium]